MVTSAVLPERFISEGFVVLRSVLSETEVDELRNELSGFSSGKYPVENPRAAKEGQTPDDVLQTVLAVNFPHRVSAVIRRYASHSRLAEALSALTGAHLPHWDGNVKLVQSILYNKPPGHLGQPWHQDESFVATRDRSLIGAWIALDDADEENGCLHVIPYSHRSGYLWPTRPTQDTANFVKSDEAYGFDDERAAPLVVSAGSVVFFNGYLLHCSHQNLANRPRRALVFHYCNAWSLLPSLSPPQKIDSSRIPSLDNRAVIPLGHDPYEWKGYQESIDQVFLRPFD